jgi:hypothetical protein
MAIKKVKTFKRTVHFSQPDPDQVDKMVSDSFVATLELLSARERAEIREKSGGVIKDIDLVQRILKDAGDNTVDDIIDNEFAVVATARLYYNVIQEGAIGKNSAT